MSEDAAERPPRRGCLRRAARVVLAAAALLALGLLVARLFLGDVYPVSSASMRPTIFAGIATPGEEPVTEWVLVRYDRSTPERGELVVLAPDNGGAPLVKRVAGLPGEAIELARGDVFVDGEPLGDDAPWRTLVPLWDSRSHAWREWLELPLAPAGPWRLDAGALVLPAGAAATLAHELVLHLPARDGYPSPRGERVPGLLPVNDLALELTLELAPEQEAGALVLALTEEGDTFALVLRPTPSAALDAVLLRAPLDVPLAELAAETPPAGVEQLFGGTLEFAHGRPSRLRFANVDDELTVAVDGARALAVSTPPNRPHGRAGVGVLHVQPRMRFASAVPLTLRRARVLRDQFWSPVGRHGVGQELLLGSDEIFVLGDNTRASTDSREFGPVRLERVIGRVKAVVWPPDRARRL